VDASSCRRRPAIAEPEIGLSAVLVTPRITLSE